MKSTCSIAVKNFLPHQDPMLMVDLISHLTPNEVITRFCIKSDNILMHNGRFQEAGLIENAAQTASCILGQHYYAKQKDKTQPKTIGYISVIKTFQILHLPAVDEILETKAKLISQHSLQDVDLCTIKVESFVVDKLVAFGELNLILRNNKQSTSK